ncbi:MAG: methionine--tRNA ligase [Patescibacteria group bacterium UBA2103]
MSKKNILIGLAWPYANGSLHLGHAAAFVGADVLARYHRVKGDDVLFVSGSDCYGTPIAVEALNKNVAPKEIAEKYHEEFKNTLIKGLNFSYDRYGATTDKGHAEVVQELFLKLYKKGFLYTKIEKALFSPFLNRFLPDRFVEGKCPHCGYDGARGDQCDDCGKLLDPLELIGPRVNTKILPQKEGVSPEDLKLEERETEHFFLKLSGLQEELTKWVSETSDSWRLNASSFAKAFLKQGLQDRAVTRDTDWGVPIPLEGYENKRIYVWFEAVCGYYSASVIWARERGLRVADWWQNDTAKHYYVHGKDNIPFHTIIWPGILEAEGSLHLPNQIVSSEYLTLEGKQFSKSRGWAVWLPEFLEVFDGELLRYFLIANGPESGDTDFSWKEFQNRVNGELIGTYGNLVNRVLTFIERNYPDGVAYQSGDANLVSKLQEGCSAVGELLEAGKFRQAFREALSIAEESNRYLDSKAPWKKVKTDDSDDVPGDLASLAHIIENLAVLFYPFVPSSSEKIFGMLGNKDSISWEYRRPQKTYKVSGAEGLFKKVEDEEIEAQLKKLSK